MNKRSAVFMAAGLVAVLTLGGMAFSRGLTGPTVSSATPRNKQAHVKPLVRTHTKKIVVHRQAPTPPARTVVMPAPSSSLRCGNHDDGRIRGIDDGRRTREFGEKANTVVVAMTDQERPKKQRWSKRAVRAAAWTAAGTAFISALGVLGAAPNPAAAGQTATKAPRKIIVRRIIKKVVIVGQAKPAPVHVVYTGGGSTTGSAPAPAPVTTGGSHP